MDVDTKAIIASAKRIIAVANALGNKAIRHDIVVEAAAIITLCGGRKDEPRQGGLI